MGIFKYLPWYSMNAKCRRDYNLQGEPKRHWNKSEICWTIEILNKHLNNIGFKGRHIISQATTPIYLGLVPATTYSYEDIWS